MSYIFVKQAIKQIGGGVRLAKALGISQSAVSQWNRVPAERVLAVEKLTGVSRSLLRPDLYPFEAANDNYLPISNESAVSFKLVTRKRDHE